MITENGKPVNTKSNIELAMERAREEGRQRDEQRAQELQNGTLRFSTEDEVGETQPISSTTGPIGVNADGQSIRGETRIYIIPDNPESQEKDMNTNINKPQSEVQAAAEAAAPATEPLVEPITTEELDTKKEEGSSLKQEPAPVEEPKQDKKKFSFKGFFKGVGERASALKDKVIKPAEKVELDQEAMLENVKTKLTLVVDNVKAGMDKLPKSNPKAEAPAEAKVEAA